MAENPDQDWDLAKLNVLHSSFRDVDIYTYIYIYTYVH